MPKAVVVPIKPKVKLNRGRRRTDQLQLPTVAPPPKGLSKKKLIEESRRWLGIINAHKLNDYKRRRIVTDTVENFASYYNKGYLEYRKSVTEGGQYAAVEWAGRGSYFEDITGRRFIDCLGGYGIYSAGIRHPKIVRAVKSQLERMPLSSQELLDPLRGALAELLGELTPGDLQDCFFINNGTDAVEGAMKLARLYTGKPGFISCVRGFHGKSYGALSLMGKGEYRLAFEPLLQDVYFVPYGDATAVEAELRKAEAVGMAIAGRRGRARAGRGGRDRPPARLLAAAARDLHPIRGPAHRGRGADGHGPHGQDVRRRSLEGRPRHHVPGQGARRRGHAALRVHVVAQDLAGPGAESLHPFVDLRRQPAGLRGGDRGRERHPRRRPSRPGRGDRRVPPRRAAEAAEALQRPHRRGARPRPAHRHGVRGHRDGLLGVGRPVPPRRARRGHAAERQDHPAGARAQHPARRSWTKCWRSSRTRSGS